MSRHLLAAAVGAALVLPALPAQAQSDAALGPLDEITVTTRRVEERLQDIPVTVTALSGEQLTELGIEDLSDLASKTPGFALEAFSGPLTQPVIRGMTQLRLTSPTQNVATVLNGVYLQRNYMIDSTLLDMERVEVIKGPQSALYGRNAFAGVLNLVTVEPGEELGAKASIGYGSDERRDYKFRINLPLASDGRAGLILGYADSYFDGTWANNHPLANAGLATDGNVGGYDKQAFYGRLVIKPSDRLKIDLFGVRTEREQEQNATYSASIRSALLPFGFTARLTPFNTLTASPQNDLRTILAVTTANPNPACPAVAAPAAASIRSVRQTSLGAFVLCEAPGTAQNRFIAGEVPALPTIAPGEVRSPGVVVDPRAFGLKGPTTVFSGKLDWTIVDNWSVSYQYGSTTASIQAVGSAVRDPVNVQQPFDNPTVNLFGGVVFDASGTFSQFDGESHEVRLAWEPNESLRSFFGVSYASTEDVDSGANQFGRPNTTDPLVPNLVRPRPGDPVPTNGGRGAGFNTYIIREETIRSAFFFVGYDFGRFELTAEGRYIDEEQTAIDFFGGVQPRQVINGVNSYALNIPVNRLDSDYFTPRVTGTFEISDDSMVYASVAKGVKSGGLNGNTPFLGQRTWDQEENWTIELGTKNEFFDRRLRVNAAVYATDWKDIQTNAVRLNADGTSPTGFAIVPTIVGNLGDVEVRGVEASVDWAITDTLSAGFAAAFTQSQYKDGARSQRFELAFLCDDVICPSNGDIGGNQLERVPEFDANAYLKYTKKFGDERSFFVRGDVSTQTKQYLEEMNIGWVPGRTLVDATAGLSFGRYDVQVWGRNLFDEEYATSSLALVGTGGARTMQYAPFMGEQRTFGISVTAEF
jgi:iron complex outermembrane recepter protein